MYACTFKTWRGFFEGVCAPCNATAHFCDPPLDSRVYAGCLLLLLGITTLSARALPFTAMVAHSPTSECTSRLNHAAMN